MSLEPQLKAFLHFWRKGGALNKQTYKIISSTQAIPGVPGEWHAGQEVDVDADTNEVLAVRLLPTIPDDAEQTPQQAITVHAQIDDKPIGSWTGTYADIQTVAVKEATEENTERIDK
jgi:hypothetical protein